jgi:hypothetical protein
VKALGHGATQEAMVTEESTRIFVDAKERSFQGISHHLIPFLFFLLYHMRCKSYHFLFAITIIDVHDDDDYNR